MTAISDRNSAGLEDGRDALGLQLEHARAGEQPLRIAMVGLRGIPATYGGVERAVEELAATLVERGHDVTVYARNAYSDSAVKQHRGVKLIHLPQVNTKHLEAITHTFVAVLHALRVRRYDVIHFHATGPSLLSGMARVAGTPTVATVQGLDWRREKWGRFARFVLKLAAGISAKVPHKTIVVSRELERHFTETYNSAPAYIPNGVDPMEPAAITSVDGLDADRFVLSLGRLVPEKHIHTLIRAYRLVPGDVPLVIAGPDSHSPEYVRELEELAAADPRVRMLGPRYGEEKAWLMQNAAMFCQVSSIEGLPIALLEALSNGRFPIVSDIPENAEPVTVDGTLEGLQVPVGDEQALADAIQAALAREDRAEVGAKLAANVRTDYDWREIAEATERVYRGVARSRVAA